MPQKERYFDACPQIQIYSTVHSDDKQLYILITNLFGRFSCICILFFSTNKLQAPGAICRNRPASPWIPSVKGSEGESIFEYKHLEHSANMQNWFLGWPLYSSIQGRSQTSSSPNFSFTKISWYLNL